MSGEAPKPSPEVAQMLDPVLYSFGFQIQHFSSQKVSGHLQITPKCCQPFKVLHGGVSALIAEGLASIGAYLASGRMRVAGVHLGIHHLKSAKLGDFVAAEAKPINVGKTIQVWEVCLWKCDPITKLEDGSRTLISNTQVTLLCTLPVPESLNDDADKLKRLAKL